MIKKIFCKCAMKLTGPFRLGDKKSITCKQVAVDYSMCVIIRS